MVTQGGDFPLPNLEIVVSIAPIRTTRAHMSCGNLTALGSTNKWSYEAHMSYQKDYFIMYLFRLLVCIGSITINSHDSEVPSTIAGNKYNSTHSSIVICDMLCELYS